MLLTHVQLSHLFSCSLIALRSSCSVLEIEVELLIKLQYIHKIFFTSACFWARTSSSSSSLSINSCRNDSKIIKQVLETRAICLLNLSLFLQFLNSCVSLQLLYKSSLQFLKLSFIFLQEYIMCYSSGMTAIRHKLFQPFSVVVAYQSLVVLLRSPACAVTMHFKMNF